MQKISFSIWKQEDERNQLVDSEVWNGGKRVDITLTQVIVEEKEYCKRCEITVHEQILS